MKPQTSGNNFISKQNQRKIKINKIGTMMKFYWRRTLMNLHSSQMPTNMLMELLEETSHPLNNLLDLLKLNLKLKCNNKDKYHNQLQSEVVLLKLNNTAAMVQIVQLILKL